MPPRLLALLASPLAGSGRSRHSVGGASAAAGPGEHVAIDLAPSSPARPIRCAPGRAFAGFPMHAAGHGHDRRLIHGDPARDPAVGGAGIHEHTTPVRVTPAFRPAEEPSGLLRPSVSLDRRSRVGMVIVGGEGGATEGLSLRVGPSGSAGADR